MYVFQERTDQHSQKQTRQLDFIFQFTTDIQHIKKSKNTTAGTLSWIAAITMPNPIDYEEISKVELNDRKLQHLIKNLQCLQLKKVTLPGQINPIYCVFPTGTARPHILVSFRKQFLSQ